MMGHDGGHYSGAAVIAISDGWQGSVATCSWSLAWPRNPFAMLPVHVTAPIASATVRGGRAGRAAPADHGRCGYARDDALGLLHRPVLESAFIAKNLIW